jgi:5-methylthioadenosine/S-adenosylhomocysteine deaminase
MQHEMRLASLVQRPAHGPDAMPAERVLAMATLGGAKALGLAGEIGSLEAGKQADLQIVAAPLLGPDDAPRLAARHLVHTATAADVRTVLVAGRPVVRDGRLVHGDLGRIRQDAVNARPRLSSALTAH